METFPHHWYLWGNFPVFFVASPNKQLTFGDACLGTIPSPAWCTDPYPPGDSPVLRDIQNPNRGRQNLVLEGIWWKSRQTLVACHVTRSWLSSCWCRSSSLLRPVRFLNAAVLFWGCLPGRTLGRDGTRNNITSWRHDRETLSALLSFDEGNPLVTGGCPSQRTSNKHVEQIGRVVADLDAPALLWRQWND